MISSNSIITACHCVVNGNNMTFPSEKFKLLLGAIDLQQLTGKEALRDVSQVIKHPDYEHDKILKQDIAFMIAKGEIQFSSTISPICLFNVYVPIENNINQSAIVIGFGSNEESKSPSRSLNYGQMEIISRQKCIESNLLFGLLPEKSAFCAKAFQNTIACPGDSGGGVIFTSNGKYYLRGVSSVTITKSDGNCDPTQSVAFTDVSFFSSWIRMNN